MAILDVLKYEGPNDVLVWKWRSESNDSRENELRMGSQLIVNESQEACFYKGGQLLDVLGPGTHTLSTKNLPVLSKLVGIVYGGNSPFAAEVYFVNKAVSERKEEPDSIMGSISNVFAEAFSDGPDKGDRKKWRSYLVFRYRQQKRTYLSFLV